MTPHQKIIHRWDSLQAFADALKTVKGERVPKSTVQGWDEGGTIPAKHHSDVLKAGELLNPPIKPDDFFGLPPATTPASTTTFKPF